MKKWALTLVSAFALQVPVWGAEIPQDILTSAQQRVEYGLNPGLVMIYVEKGQAPVIRTWGKISLEPQARSVTEDTSFEIGSLTKIFTALEAARLVENQKLAPDQPLKTIWPAAWGPLNISLEQIPLKSLLSHSSGLPRLPENFQPKQGHDPYVDYSPKLLSQFMANYTLEKKPPTYSYSNFAYGLLGGLLPSYSGQKTYEDMLQANILQPLGMKSTSSFDPRPPQVFAQPHFEGVPVAPWHFSEVTTGAGSLRSNGQDLAHFLQAQLTPPPGLLGRAIQRSHQVLFTGSEKVAYGWHLHEKEGQTIYTHNGLTGGSLSFIGLDLKAGKAAVVLTNNTDAVVDLGLRLLDGKTPLRSLKDGRTSENLLQTYVGKYELMPGMIFNVTQAAGYLVVQLTGQPALRVYPTGSPRRFKYQIVEAEIEFKTDDQGQIIGLILYQNGYNYAPRLK